jgi:hypothetical protein
VQDAQVARQSHLKIIKMANHSITHRPGEGDNGGHDGVQDAQVASQSQLKIIRITNHRNTWHSHVHTTHSVLSLWPGAGPPFSEKAYKISLERHKMSFDTEKLTRKK